jgi:hypothetical protein
LAAHDHENSIGLRITPSGPAHAKQIAPFQTSA